MNSLYYFFLYLKGLVMNHKRNIKVALVALYWLVLLGFIAPFLISATSWTAVVFCFALILVSAYLTITAVFGFIEDAPTTSEPEVPLNEASKPGSAAATPTDTRRPDSL